MNEQTNEWIKTKTHWRVYNIYQCASDDNDVDDDDVKYKYIQQHQQHTRQPMKCKLIEWTHNKEVDEEEKRNGKTERNANII